MSDPVLQVLGQIEGKLDLALKSLDRHIDDDVRRFTELHQKTDSLAEDINKAKGAKGVIVWLVGAVAGVAGAVATHILKIKGGG